MISPTKACGVLAQLSVALSALALSSAAAVYLRVLLRFAARGLAR